MLQVLMNGTHQRCDTRIECDGVLFHHNCSGYTNRVGADYCVDFHRISAVSMEFPKERRIYVVNESPIYYALHCALQQIPKIREHYGLILSNEVMSLQWPGVKYANIFPIWTTPRTPADMHNKRFGISACFSAKSGLDQYEWRHIIVKERGQITIPERIMHQGEGVKTGPFTCGWNHESKDPCFDWMFHLAMENCRAPGYHTEKVVDCFVTCTVPVYWGDHDIGKRWNTDGIVILHPEFWLEQINFLTPDLYREKRDAIIDNWERAKRYWTFERSLLVALQENNVFGARVAPEENGCPPFLPQSLDNRANDLGARS